jgi:formylglycine-generating enzyme required for sulfatase activity
MVLRLYGTYPTTPQTDPTGPGTSFGQSKVVRRGAYIYGAKSCRNAQRFLSVPNNSNYISGFRVGIPN